jgi:hypothetical protein
MTRFSLDEFTIAFRNELQTQEQQKADITTTAGRSLLQGTLSCCDKHARQWKQCRASASPRRKNQACSQQYLLAPE